MADIQADIAGASQDLQTIEDFVNLPAGNDVRPRLLPSVNVGTLAGTRQAIFEAGGLPATPFKRYYEMNTSSLEDGSYAVVTDSDDASSNGLYYKEAGMWTRSAFNDFFDRKSTDYHLSFFKPNSINFDFNNNKIVVANDIWIPTAHGRILVAPTTINLDPARLKTPDRVLLVNRSTSKIITAEATGVFKTPANHVVIGGYNELRLNTWGLENVLVNGKKQKFEELSADYIPNYHIAFFKEGALDIDLQGDKIKLTGGLWIPLKDRRVYITDQTVQLDPNRIKLSGFYIMLLVNLTNNTLTIAEGNSQYKTPDNHIIIGAYLETTGNVWGLQGVLVNGKPVSGKDNKRIVPYPFDADKYPAINVTDSFYTGEGVVDMSDINSTVVYGWYDALVAEYPEYVTKVNKGFDASGVIPIYEYIFKPMSLELSAGKGADTPRVMVIALHNEQINFVYPYIGMREICKTWRTNESLEGLRWGAEIRVIPCLNPWGLDNKSRTNSNGVDINRNFPHWFRVVTEPPTNASGATALSESEAQIGYAEMLAYKPHIMIDCHSYGTVKDNGQAVWLEALSEADRIICNNVAKRTYLDMYKQYGDWMVAYKDWTLLMDTVPNNGTAGNARHYLGMLGGNLEIAWNMRNNNEAYKKGGTIAVNYTANVFLCFMQECLKFADKYGVELKQIN